MAVRFRIRTSQGQELSFASHEMFEEFVRSGDLAPDDLVYDGETSEWAPARTHPLVLEIEYEKEEEAEAEAKEAEPAPTTAADLGLSLAEAPPPPPGDADSFGLELAPPTPHRSPEEENRAFVDKMASERAMNQAFGGDLPSAGVQGIRMEDSSALAEMVKAEPKPEPKPRRLRPEPPARIKVARPKPKRTGRKLAAAVVLLGVVGSGGYFAMGLMGSPDMDTPVDSLTIAPDPVPPPPPRQPVIASTEDAVRGRARERFLSSTQALLAALQPIPAAWLSGPYFALPSDHPDVLSVWQSYRATIRTVRAGDEARYRTAYESALDDAGIADPDERARRIATATTAFAARVPDLDAHWGRVEALAVAAIQGHNALLEVEGLVLYDPTGTTGRPAGLGVGTSGRDSDAQLRLDQVIALMQRVLDADGLGPREGANVREWVGGGFLDVISR